MAPSRRRWPTHVLIPLDGRLEVPCGLQSRKSFVTEQEGQVTCLFCLDCLKNLRLAKAYRAKHVEKQR